MLNPAAELAIPIGIPTNEAKTEIDAKKMLKYATV